MSAGVSDQRMKGQGNQGSNVQKDHIESSENFESWRQQQGNHGQYVSNADPYNSGTQQYQAYQTPFDANVRELKWSSGGGNENLSNLGGGYQQQHQQNSHDNYGNDGNNGDYNNAWNTQNVNQQQQQQQQRNKSGSHYDNYYNRDHGSYQQNRDDHRIKDVEHGMQGLGIDASQGQEKKNSGSNQTNSSISKPDKPKESIPKAMTWASVASQPAKPQLRTSSSTSTIKKKGPGMPPPPMVPGRHNMDIGTWDSSSKNPPSMLVPPPIPPPVMTAQPPPPPMASQPQQQNAVAKGNQNIPPPQHQQQQPPPGHHQGVANHKNMNQPPPPMGVGGNGGSGRHHQDGAQHSGGHPGNNPMRMSWGMQAEREQQQQQQHVQQRNNSHHPHQQHHQGGPPMHGHQQQQHNNQRPPPPMHQQGVPPGNVMGQGRGGPSPAQNQQPPQQPYVPPQTNQPQAALQQRNLQSPVSNCSSTGSHPVLEQLRDKNNYNPEELDLEITSKARFFVIKSYSEDDIHRSIKYEIWCSTEHGNNRLDQAFREIDNDQGVIYLFFSVNGSGHFCGVAQMISAVDYDSNSSVWSQNKWKGVFKVKWVYVKDVPNQQLRHIQLENNDDKPVTNSRDTQEVPLAKGQQVLRIIHAFKHTTSIFDDFIHYEKRQMEEDSRKGEGPASAHSTRRERNDYQQYDRGDKPQYDKGNGYDNKHNSYGNKNYGGYDKHDGGGYNNYHGGRGGRGGYYNNYDNRRGGDNDRGGYDRNNSKDHYEGGGGYYSREGSGNDYNNRNNRGGGTGGDRNEYRDHRRDDRGGYNNNRDRESNHDNGNGGYRSGGGFRDNYRDRGDHHGGGRGRGRGGGGGGHRGGDRGGGGAASGSNN